MNVGDRVLSASLHEVISGIDYRQPCPARPERACGLPVGPERSAFTEDG